MAGFNHAMNYIGDSLSFKNQKELDNYINENLGPKDKIEAEAKTKILLATDANLAKDGNGYNLDWSGNMSDSKGYGVAGFTIVPDKNGFTSTFIAPRAKTNYPLMTIVHELVHSYGQIKGFHNTDGVARTYTVAYLKAYNTNPALIHSYRIKGMNNYDSQSSWRKLLPNYINTGLKR